MRHPTLEDTVLLVCHAFGGLKDKAGVLISDHCLRVRANVQGQPLLHEYVALLHDIIEDTHVDADYLKLCGYHPEILEAVDLLTHNKKEMSYPEYIDRICASRNAAAIQVKIADQKDNLDPKRWLHLNRYQSNALRKRYAGVMDKLEEALHEIEHLSQKVG